jgi:hypothetical protein
MSSNIVLSWPNLVDKATLTSPDTWVTTLPLGNLQDPVLSNIAKIADTDTSISATFSGYTQLSTVALANHNLSVTATVRIYAYYDTAQTTLLYDSGDIEVWQRVYDSLDLNWEDDNFWDGKPSNEQRQEFTPLFYYYLPNILTAKAVKIVITDDDNPDDFISLGRLFLGRYFIPDYNASYEGFERTAISKTTVVECNNTRYYRVRKTARMQTLNLAYLNQAEALQKIYHAQITQGIDKEILYSDSTTIDQYSIMTSILGTLENLSPIAQPNFSQYGAKLNIMEKL